MAQAAEGIMTTIPLPKGSKRQIHPGGLDDHGSPGFSKGCGMINGHGHQLLGFIAPTPKIAQPVLQAYCARPRTVVNRITIDGDYLDQRTACMWFATGQAACQKLLRQTGLINQATG